MSLVIQRGVIFDDLIVQHYEVLDDLTARPGRLQSLFILRDLLKQRVYLVDLMLVADVSLTLLPLLVVLVHGRALLLQRLHDNIHAVIRILHDQSKRLGFLFCFCLWIIVVVAPYKRNTVGVVKVSLDSLERRKCKPADEATHIFQLVVWL